MTDKELRKLKRADLIELLLAQSRAADEREAELSALRQEKENRRIQIAEAGSIAEASLRLNHVFEAAQAAADQYLESFADVGERTQAMEAAARSRCETLERETGERCRAMEEAAAKAEAESRRACKEREEKTRRHCEEMIQDAKLQSRQYWDEARAKMDGYISERQELQNLFQQTWNAAGAEDDGNTVS